MINYHTRNIYVYGIEVFMSHNRSYNRNNQQHYNRYAYGSSQYSIEYKKNPNGSKTEKMLKKFEEYYVLLNDGLETTQEMIQSIGSLPNAELNEYKSFRKQIKHARLLLAHIQGIISKYTVKMHNQVEELTSLQKELQSHLTSEELKKEIQSKKEVIFKKRDELTKIYQNIGSHFQKDILCSLDRSIAQDLLVIQQNIQESQFLMENVSKQRFATLKDKNDTTKKNFDCSKSYLTYADHKIAEVEKKLRLCAEVDSQDISIESRKELVAAIKFFKDNLKRAKAQFEEEEKIYNQSMAKLLADKKIDGIIDHLINLQESDRFNKHLDHSVAGRPYFFKGSLSLLFGIYQYQSPKAAANVIVNDVDEVFFTKNPKTICEYLESKEYKRGVSECNAEGNIIYAQMYREMDGKKIDLTIANRQLYTGNELIASLGSGRTTIARHCYSRQHYNSPIDHKYSVYIDPKHNKHFINACISNSGMYASYNPLIHKKYCCMLLKYQSKSEDIFGPCEDKSDSSSSKSPDKLISYQTALTIVKQEFYQCFLKATDHPDREIYALLAEHKEINQKTRPYITAYIDAYIGYTIDHTLKKAVHPKSRQHITDTIVDYLSSRLIDYKKIDKSIMALLLKTISHNILTFKLDNIEKGLSQQIIDKCNSKIDALQSQLVHFSIYRSGVSSPSSTPSSQSSSTPSQSSFLPAPFSPLSIASAQNQERRGFTPQ